MANNLVVAAVAAALCSLAIARRDGAAAAAKAKAAGAPLVPAVFVFGDSTVDVGNNNFLPGCIADCRANYPRYGVDYPGGSPTGRFSNGYNLADQIAQLLGFTESPPAFLSLSKENVAKQMKSGINFASGGSGLLDETGKHVCGQVMSMSSQVQAFTKIAEGMTGNGTAGLLSKSLVFLSVGSNDLFEYTDAPPPAHHDDAAFLKGLIALYTSYLKELYGAGARRFSVVSPSLVGCCPSQRVVARNRSDVDTLGCFGSANALSKRLYPMMEAMLKGLSLQLPGLNYSLGDSVGMAEFVFNGAAMPGTNFTVLDKACCGAGQFGAGGCNGTAPMCEDRASYLFWDDYHATDAGSRAAATGLFTDPGLFVHPVNVAQLVQAPPRAPHEAAVVE